MTRRPLARWSLRARLALLGAGLLAAGGCSERPRVAAPVVKAEEGGAAGTAGVGHAPVLVSVVVDQFAAWIADERLPVLPPEGGFARLVREGTYVREAHYDHGATDTAPGHAAIYTGAAPRQSGIYANEIVTAAGKRVGVLRDEATRLVGLAGPLATVGSSAVRLQAETLADKLRASAPSATIVSLSLKDRGAILGGGRHPDAALWFDPGAGSFVTSTAFAQKLPAWAGRHAKPASLAGGEAAIWTPLDEAWVKAHALTADPQAGEGDWLGFGVAFPHKLSASTSPASVYRATPFGDDDLFALALDALDAPRAPDQPMLLALSLSSNDFVGHIFGPDSWEAWDELARLDRALGRFLSELDRRLGPAGYGFLLTGDHGSTPLPEVAAGGRRACGAADHWQRPCAGLRLSADGLAEELAQAATRALGPGTWVLNVADPFVVLSDAARALPPLRRAVLDEALRGALGRHSRAIGLLAVDELRGPCPPFSDESILALLCRSVPAAGAAGPEGGGDYYIVFEPGGFFEAYTPGRSSNHGSPYLYDRAVPIFARAPGRVRAGARVGGVLPVATFVHTAAALLGIAPPASARVAPSLAHGRAAR